MTRINCIPARELTDKHLVAEYRELPRVSKLARHPKPGEMFPNSYTLGKGHITFFYSRGGYLEKRFKELVAEMKRRGFKPQYAEYRQHPDGLNNDWEPTTEAIMINHERINERLL